MREPKWFVTKDSKVRGLLVDENKIVSDFKDYFI